MLVRKNSARFFCYQATTLINNAEIQTNGCYCREYERVKKSDYSLRKGVVAILEERMNRPLRCLYIANDNGGNTVAQLLNHITFTHLVYIDMTDCSDNPSDVAKLLRNNFSPELYRVDILFKAQSCEIVPQPCTADEAADFLSANKDARYTMSAIDDRINPPSHFSSLENDVHKALTKAGIAFDTGAQMSCLGRKHLDVLIRDCNIAIECQGKQHFEPIEYFGGQESYERQRKNDVDKRESVTQEGIQLLYYANAKDVPQDWSEYPVITNLDNLVDMVKSKV